LVLWARGSLVDIAIRYGLDGPGIEFRWGGGEIPPHPSRPAHPPLSRAEVKESVESYATTPLCLCGRL
jgi:hypothetical protein